MVPASKIIFFRSEIQLKSLVEIGIISIGLIWDLSLRSTLALLFFGNFHGMSLQDYNWGMTEMLGDKEYMNNSMIKDNYFLGVVLAKKYKYLRIAYNIFMYGLILTVIAFAVSSMIPQATEVYT